jgi:hypothetical protein
MRVKRTLAISAIALVSLAGLGYIGFQVRLLHLGIDEDPPDDSDLRVEPLEIPDEQNAFYWLSLAAGKAVVPWEMTEEERAASLAKTEQELRALGILGTDTEADSEGDADRGSTGTDGVPDSEEAEQAKGLPRHEAAEERLFEILSGEEWDAAFAANVLETNEAVFKYWDRAVACERMQVPWLLSMEDGCRIRERLGRLLRLRGMRLLHSGQPGRARDLGREMVDMGHRWEGAHTSLPSYWHGVDLKASGVALLDRWASEASPDSAHLRRLAKWLTDYGANEEGIRYALRVEYMLNTFRLEAMMQGKMSIADIGPMTLSEDGLSPIWPKKHLIPGWRFRPNETRRWMVEWYNTLLRAVADPYARFRPPSLPEVTRGYVNLLWKGNPLGRLVCNSLLPYSKEAIPVKCRENTIVGSSQIEIALRAFRQDAGRMPQKLEELVPKYLDSVPLDGFDGQPLRYNPEKEVIYSVGKDFVDGGGMTQEEVDAWWKEEDPWEAEEGHEPPFWDLPDPSWPVEF